MILKKLSFIKCLVALTAVACFVSSGDEWSLVAVVGIYLAHDLLISWRKRHELDRISIIEQALGDLKTSLSDIPNLRTDLTKVQEHVKNLQLTKHVS